MKTAVFMPSDRELIQIVDASLAEAARLAGAWLACRPGCAECCMEPFAITPLDAQRLRDGLAELESRDPGRAARVRARAAESVERLTREYPDDTVAQVLAIDEAGENELCPALDPETRTCDLYGARPITCRAFGPPVRFNGESIAVCELCFDGATVEEVERCVVEIDPENLEAELVQGFGDRADTIVAFALIDAPSAHGQAGRPTPPTAT
jgi:Fe-S-cluster containining protein